MRRLVPTMLLGLTLALTGGCADLEFSNPFSSTSDVNDVYYSKFPDIPIPSDMKSDIGETLVSSTPNAVKVGLETFSGRVESSSLASATTNNMTPQGWVLRGQVTGKRTMQLFEKDGRFAAIYLYDGMMNTTMEVWVLYQLEGSSSAPAFSIGAPGAAPGSTGNASSPVWDDSFTPASSATEVWEGQSTSR